MIHGVIHHFTKLLYLKFHPDRVLRVLDRDAWADCFGPKQDARLIESINHTRVVRVMGSAIRQTKITSLGIIVFHGCDSKI